MALINIFEFFQQIAEKYPESEMTFCGEVGKRRHQITCKLLEGEQGTVLDVGCHDGHFAPYTKDYVGLDFALPCLKRFKKPRVWADALKLPFKNGSFDLIICLEVMEHIYHHLKLLKGFHRVLKTDGRLFLSVPHGNNPWQTVFFPDFSDYGITNREYLHGSFTVEYLSALFDSAGFHVDDFSRIKNSSIIQVLAHKVTRTEK